MPAEEGIGRDQGVQVTEYPSPEALGLCGQAPALGVGCFRHQLLLPRPYLVLTKPLRLDIQCQRAASVKIGWKYLDD